MHQIEILIEISLKIIQMITGTLLGFNLIMENYNIWFNGEFGIQILNIIAWITLLVEF